MANLSRNGHMQTKLMHILLLICLSFNIYTAKTTSIMTQKMEFVSVGNKEINHQNWRSKSSRRMLNNINHTLSEKSEEGFRVDLIHRDAPSSYLGVKNITRLERLRLAVQRSLERARSLAATQNGYGADFSQKPTTTDFTSPVASDFGAYLMQLQLGTPVQNFQAIVDTGSDLVWVQCNPCRSCFTQQAGSVFSPSSSSTYKQLSCNSPKCKSFSNRICNPNCQYVYQYGDQSGTMGDFSSETVTMTTTTGSSQQIPNFAFGCGHANMGSFGGAGGLVGLGQGPASLTTQLGTQIQRKFSYCLVSFDDAPSTTSPLFFGSAADLHVPGVRSTPILKQGSTYYYVGLGGVSVGGKQASRSVSTDSLTIFDSGTTLTLLDDPIYAGLRSAFQNSIHLPPGDGSAAGFDLCFDATGLTSYNIPTLSLHFTDADFSPPAANYFVLVDSNTLCLAIASSQGLGLSIIGNIMQQNYHIKYDRGRSSLSFVPTTCDSL